MSTEERGGARWRRRWSAFVADRREALRARSGTDPVEDLMPDTVLDRPWMDPPSVRSGRRGRELMRRLRALLRGRVPSALLPLAALALTLSS
ncbi:hypothetical protein Afil01_51040 [Actinorhabdospora filicis]|uniref:Uncharacterized protein n=1 Tax=Actinorhabdospora filicis TaxID=1785913 RepID=A0A9W6SR20_9ACTN|nr:hypothetical protein [Actinorhabdospora filicis]GLZ80297.1 hypothetical protein Afil01_51040 [Actinorhabdospora filicis]